MAGILDGLLGPLIQSTSRAVGEYQDAQAKAKRQQIEDTLKQRELDRRDEQDRIVNALRQRQADEATQRQLMAEKVRAGQFGLTALRQGLVQVPDGDQGTPSMDSIIPMPQGPRVPIGDDTFEYRENLDPAVRQRASTLAAIEARGDQSRQTRATTPARASGSADHRRRDYILKRIGELTKPSAGKFGMASPGMDRAAAQRQAVEEWNAVEGATAPNTPTRPHSAGGTGGTMSTSLQARHRQIDQDLQDAVAGGADPQKAMERASQLHAQLMGLGE